MSMGRDAGADFEQLSTTSSINLPMLRKRRHQRLHCDGIVESAVHPDSTAASK